MNRSVVSRNLAGGFLGGVVGILALWYAAPMALPFGVLIGVIVGWWAEDIAQAFVHSFHISVGFWRQRKRAWASSHAFLQHLGVLLLVACRKVVTAVQYVILLPLLFLLPLLLVRRFRQWTTHPVSMALLISVSAIVIGAAINAFVFGMFWPWPEVHTVGGGLSNKPMGVVPFELSDIVFFTGIVTVFLTMFGAIGVFVEHEDTNLMRGFYSCWERYSRCSPTSYFVRELVRFFRSEVTAVILFVLAIAYWVTLGGALIALVVIPVATFVTFMVGLYKIAQRSAHWWCLSVTLVVTATSAFIFYGSFSNEVVLWIVALCTGLVSGVGTEGLRRLGVWWSNTEMGQHYLDIWYDEYKVLPFSIAKPAWRTLTRAFGGATQRVLPFAA